MSEHAIVQSMISRLGQSQRDRFPRELDPAFAQIDARSGAELLELARRLAKHVHHYGSDPTVADGTWSAFFPDGLDASILERTHGDVPPHLGLFVAFLKLYEHPQRRINRLTAAHMDFQVSDVLGFVPTPRIADRAHVVIELKKGSAPTAITTSTRFSGGKDADKVELLYAPVREVVVGGASIDSIRTIHHRDGILRCAPIANAPDGLGDGSGAPNSSSREGWCPFGHQGLPTARVGFAIASPTLRLAEGERTIAIELQFGSLDPSTFSESAFDEAFDAYLSGPKGWIGPLRPSATLSGNRLTLRVSLAPSTPAVVDYVAAIHGQHFAAVGPVVSFQWRAEGPLGYRDLMGLAVASARVRVEAKGITSLAIENDAGSLNPKKAFQPFGPQPTRGARFHVGCEEAFSKELVELKVEIRWKGAPTNLRAYYHDYPSVEAIADGVETRLANRDRQGNTKTSATAITFRDGVSLLEPTAPTSTSATSTDTTGMAQNRSGNERMFALRHAGSTWATREERREGLANRLFARAGRVAPQARAGALTAELVESFLHAEFRSETIRLAMARVNASKDEAITVLNEPYTPTASSIALSYAAVSDEVRLDTADQASFGTMDAQFFHAGCFGERREHPYLRRLAGATGTTTTLLADAAHEGECLIGLTGIGAGDALSMLVQVVPGSADPEVAPPPVEWAVLCDNDWRRLTERELVLDATHGFRTSGVVAITLPRETTLEHTFMPSGMVWLQASVATGSDAISRVLEILPNAVELQLHDAREHPPHLGTPLPAGSIGKMKPPIASVKSIRQPFATFGGRRRESPEEMRARAAERVRHRGRCIAAWDYERSVLEAFPSIHRVKCVPHASATSWLAPGHVMLVVVPDIRNRHASDPLRPRCDTDTLGQVQEFLQARAGSQVRVSVKNPLYQAVRLDFRVRLRSEQSFNFQRGEIDRQIVRALSPWAFADATTIEFGGFVYRSKLLNLVEELPSVEYVTDFRMQVERQDGSLSPDVSMAQAATPDAILVSSASHLIGEA